MGWGAEGITVRGEPGGGTGCPEQRLNNLFPWEFSRPSWKSPVQLGLSSNATLSRSLHYRSPEVGLILGGRQFRAYNEKKKKYWKIQEIQQIMTAEYQGDLRNIKFP